MTFEFNLKGNRRGAIGAMAIAVLLIAFLVSPMASAQSTKQIEAKPPTCTQPVGKWQNERKSVLEIKTYDAATGAISGQYTSASGKSASSTPYPVVGWRNSAPAEASAPGKETKSNHAEVIAFAVYWGKIGGLSAWVGTCAVNSQSSGHEQISALWHTTRPNTGFDWDHTLTGSDRFDPIE